VLNTLAGQVEVQRLYDSLGYRRWPDRDPTGTGRQSLVYRRDLRRRPRTRSPLTPLPLPQPRVDQWS
jgi:hypothetical protein